MKILFSATPVPGHVLPLLSLADAATEQGHDIAFLTGASLAPFLGTRELLAAGPEFGELVAENSRRIGGAHQIGPSAAELFAGTRVDLTWDEALKQALDHEPDLIVAEWVDFVGSMLAARLDVPWIAQSIGGPLPVDFVEPMRERSAQQHAQRSLTPRDRLGLVDPFPDSLRMPTDTAPEPGRVTIRPSAVSVSLAGQPGLPVPPRVSGVPRALLTVGTSVTDPTLLTTFARSVADVGVEVLVTSGPDAVPADPRVHAVGFTPLGELLPEADVVIGAAGSGTLLASLDAGVPSVLLPVLADQPLNAARAAARGTAEVIDHPAQAGAAVCRILANPTFREAAQAVAAETAAMNSPAQALAKLLAV